MVQNKEKIRNNFCSKNALFTRYTPFCAYYKIINILSFNERIVLKFCKDVYVVVLQTVKNSFNDIQNIFKIAAIQKL